MMNKRILAVLKDEQDTHYVRRLLPKLFHSAKVLFLHQVMA